MNNNNRLRIAAHRAQARRAKNKNKCSDCKNYKCRCDVSTPEYIQDSECLTAEDVTNIVLDVAEQLNLTDETETKLIAETCVQANAVDPISTAEIKAIVEQCVKTDAEIRSLVLEVLLENSNGQLTIELVNELIDQAVGAIDLPDTITDLHIKSVALQCVLDNVLSESDVKDIVEGCLPEPIDYKALVLECLIDNPQGLSELQVSVIFNDLIDGLIPTDDDIKFVFEKCLADWGIAPDCIKDYVRDCVVRLLPEPLTKEQVHCFVSDCFGERLHLKSDIVECVNNALLCAPKPRSDQEIIAVLNNEFSDSRLKAFVLECIGNQDGQLWTQTQITALIQELTLSDDQLKLVILNCLDNLQGEMWTQVQLIELIEQIAITKCQVQQIAEDVVDDAGILNEQTVTAIAKAVAIQCIADNPVDTISIEDVKSVFLDCFKDLIKPNEAAKLINLDIDCDSAGQITIELLDNKGEKITGQGDLSKFINRPDTSVCFGFDSDDVFDSDDDGKVQLDLHLKVNEWDSEASKHVEYNADAKCLEIPYCGPSAQDIADLIAEQLVDFGGGTNISVPTTSDIKAIAQQCVDLLPPIREYCIDDVFVNTVGTVVTVEIRQANCNPVEFSFDVAGNTGTGCCVTDLDVIQNGNTYTLTMSQSGGPDVSTVFTVDSVTGCCNNGMNIVRNGDQYTVTLQQSNGPDVTSSFTVSEQCCNTGLNIVQNGNIYTVTLEQSNGPDVSSSFIVTPPDAEGCCNTGFTGPTLLANGNLQYFLNQSNGDPVSLVVPQSGGDGGFTESQINAFIENYVSSLFTRCVERPNGTGFDVTLVDSNNVTVIDSIIGCDWPDVGIPQITCVTGADPENPCFDVTTLNVDGEDLCKLPAYVAESCACACVKITQEGQTVSVVGTSSSGYTVSSDENSSTSSAGGGTVTVNYTFQTVGDHKIKICLNDPCDTFSNWRVDGAEVDYSCCG